LGVDPGYLLEDGVGFGDAFDRFAFLDPLGAVAQLVELAAQAVRSPSSSTTGAINKRRALP
jgi:hypothetical protein